MSSQTAKKIVALYSILVGVLAFFATIYSEISPITLVIEILITCAGILLLIRIKPSLIKTILITLFIINCIGILGSIPFIVSDTIVGIIALVIFSVPFTFEIIYFVKKRKEKDSLS